MRSRKLLSGMILLAALLHAPQARAHAILMRSTPAEGAIISTSPGLLLLEFNSRIDPGRSILLLTGPAGAVPLTTLPQPAPNQLAAKHSTLPAGAYQLRWQALSTDGHLTRGELHFRVR